MDIHESVVFSGRFDPPHPGHIINVIRLSRLFSSVNLVILDYPERDYPIEYVKSVFSEALRDYSVNIIQNKTHFGEMTEEEWKSYLSKYYASGNLKVLRHMENLGVKCVYVERAFDYNASDYKRLD